MEPASATIRSTWTTDPAGTALRTMGETARRAADTWTMQQWAGQLAAQAGPRDYVGQLRQLYDDVGRRWRYVQEDGERVPGTPRALLGHVLGAWYNQGPDCPDAEHCDVEKTPWNRRGFGDCDDVATLLAGAALSIGMRPYFRVARWQGGAHVSTMVETPKGERVNLDPVGEPEHAFGWAMSAPQIELFDMDGRKVGNGGAAMQQQAMSGGDTIAPTYMAGLGEPRQLDTPHMVAVRPGDMRGPRILGIPTWHYRMMARGGVEDGMAAVDQYGDVYEYDRAADLWAPLGAVIGDDYDPMGRRRGRRRRRRRRKRRGRVIKRAGRTKIGRRLRRRVRQVRRVVGRVARKVGGSKLARIYRRAKTRILSSKLVQGIAARALNVFGVPAAATKAVLQREAELAKRGGRAKIAELLAAGKTKQAAKLIARATGAGIKHGVRSLIPSVSVLSGFDGEEDIAWEMDDGPMQGIPVAPVAGFERVPGWYGFGQLDVADEPTPGRWYRFKFGDTFHGVVGRAFGIKGGTRLRKAQEINAVAANRRIWGPPAAKGKTERKWYPEGRVSLNPRFACDAAVNVAQGGPNEGCYALVYLAVAGEEPPPYEEPIPPDEPVEPEEPEEPTIELPDVDDPVEPEPEEPIAPPVEPEEPITPAPPVEPDPPKPVIPPPPVEPEPPAEPEVVEPEQPEVVKCPPGLRFDPNTGKCEPMCPPGYTYDPVTNQCKSTAPVQCPPGYQLAPGTTNKCIPSVPPETPEILDPEPVIEEPPPPVQPPAKPSPTTPGAAGPWLVALLATAATGSPLPLVGAAIMERE